MAASNILEDGLLFLVFIVILCIDVFLVSSDALSAIKFDTKLVSEV